MVEVLLDRGADINAVDAVSMSRHIYVKCRAMLQCVSSRGGRWCGSTSIRTRILLCLLQISLTTLQCVFTRIAERVHPSPHSMRC